MKKIINHILALTILLSIISVPINSFAAYGDPITLTASSAAGAAGDEIVISLNISANSGLAAAGLYLEFDNTKLDFTFIQNDDDEIYNPSAGYAASQTAAASVFNYFIEGTTTKVSQNFIREAGTNRAGALMNVTVKIKSGWSGSTPIVVSYRDDFADGGIAPNYEPRNLKPYTTLVNGSVTIQGSSASTTLTPATTTGSNGGTAATEKSTTMQTTAPVPVPVDKVEEALGPDAADWNKDYASLNNEQKDKIEKYFAAEDTPVEVKQDGVYYVDAAESGTSADNTDTASSSINESTTNSTDDTGEGGMTSGKKIAIAVASVVLISAAVAVAVYLSNKKKKT